MKQNTKVRTRIGVIKPEASIISNNVRDAKSELFVLGVSRFYGEKTFYEKDANDAYKYLVQSVTKTDPEWVAAYLKWLRNDANIRTAALVGAVEYVKAGGPNGRSVVKSVINRADEPAELLAYYINNYGKSIPQPIKRGVRDSAQELYTERNFARWDSNSSAVRMADVVELTHTKPSGTHQSHLFQYMLEDRHGRGSFEDKFLDELEIRSKATTRADYLGLLSDGNRTISWENVSSAGKGPMSADEWLAVWPYMGYMARLRNLNNLDKAGVSVKDKRKIGEWLANPENVVKSRQLPMRFYSAYKTVGDDVWKSYLSEALEFSLVNVPTVRGKWLVLVDASGSMTYGYSERGTLTYYDAAAVFAAAFARVNDSDIRTYSNDLSKILQSKGQNVLRTVDDLHNHQFFFGGGTATYRSLKEAYNSKYTGVLLLTDEQYNISGNPNEAIPLSVPLYTFNLAGYAPAHDIGPNRINVAGLSDSGFSMIAAVESGKNKWPWE